MMSERQGHVYALLDKEGRPRYVGVTHDPEMRVRKHWSCRNVKKHKTPALAEWLRSLPGRPSYHVLEVVSHEQRYAAERHWITMLMTVPSVSLLNVASGNGAAVGHRGWSRGRTLTEEHKAKISAASKGVPRDYARKPMSEETKAKISASHLRRRDKRE